MLLDTTVLIDALNRRPGILRRLASLQHPFIASVISVDEIVAGMHPRDGARTRSFIEGLNLIAVGRDEAWLAGEWRRRYRAEGRRLPRADTLIAATAATAGLPLATANVRDFPMPELHVEHWPSE